jgi:hypothetical protein
MRRSTPVSSVLAEFTDLGGISRQILRSMTMEQSQ